MTASVTKATRSGSSTSDRDDDAAPGCLPGLRPERVRDERRFARALSHGASEDGGREEFDESAPNRRSSSAIRSACSPMTRSCSTTRAESPPTSTNSCS